MPLQDTSASTDMAQLIEIEIATCLVDDEHFNFSVRLHTSLMEGREAS